MNSGARARNLTTWFILVTLVCAFVVVPFVFWEDALTSAETGSLLVAFAATIALPLALMRLSRPGKLVGWA